MKVVHCKKSPYDIYIGRTYGKLKDTGWGNPFVVGVDGNRETCVRKFEWYLITTPELLARLPELVGKTLGCWCSPLACHGDILVEYAKKTPEELTRIKDEYVDLKALEIYEQDRYKTGGWLV